MVAWKWRKDPREHVPGFGHVLTDAEMRDAEKREPGIRAHYERVSMETIEAEQEAAAAAAVPVTEPEPAAEGEGA